MKKLIFGAIALFIGALVYPGTRPAVVDALGPVADYVMDPILAWNTRGEMERIIRELASHERVNYELPRPVEFQSWANEKMGGGVTTDPWGSDYIFRVTADSMILLSPGADERMETEDDIRLSQKRPGR